MGVNKTGDYLELMTLRKIIYHILLLNPSLSKGEIMDFLNLHSPFYSKEISYGIWKFNELSGRTGGYTMKS